MKQTRRNFSASTATRCSTWTPSPTPPTKSWRSGAAGLVRYYRGDKLVVINKTALGTGADLTITEPIGEVMAQL